MIAGDTFALPRIKTGCKLSNHQKLTLDLAKVSTFLSAMRGVHGRIQTPERSLQHVNGCTDALPAFDRDRTGGAVLASLQVLGLGRLWAVEVTSLQVVGVGQL